MNNLTTPTKHAARLLLACLMVVPVLAGEAGASTLVGAGDIAECGAGNDEATAALLDRIPGTVYTLGDNVYQRGTANEFRDCYAPSWGAHKNRTRPSAGNHDYYTAGAGPYYGYFGPRAGNPNRGYYSYRSGSWHVVVLNSNCAKVGGCGPRSPQGRWLARDLDAHPNRCTLAYFHHPLFSSGEGKETTTVRPLWKTLHARGADVILSAHAHRYERFAPQTPAGVRSATGIRQFIVGTGGKPPEGPMGTPDPNSVRRNDDTPGVLKLELKNGTYDWDFVPIAGKTFTDSGKARCH